MTVGRCPGSRTLARACLVVASTLLLGACTTEGGVLDPDGAGARDISVVWWYMFWAATAVFVLVVVVMAVALVRRPRSSSADAGAGNRRRERWFILGGGLVLPAVVLTPLFVLNIETILDLPDSGELTVEVIGHQYWWEYRYPGEGIETANELTIPVGRPVRLRMTSDDVIHGFWVPQLAGKRDTIPGHVNALTLLAEEPGRYVGMCSEFCGAQHANMEVVVEALPAEEFDRWMAAAATPAPEPATASQQRGYEVFMDSGCGGCHAIAGTEAEGRYGPSLTRFATRETIAAGAAPNERGYLGGWVVNPQSLKPGSTMPPMQVPAEGMGDLLDYLESLR